MSMPIIEVLGFVTCFVIGLKSVFFMWQMFRCYFLTKLGFTCDLQQFGEWAVVTGATDGIGKEYARQLAKKGFNIVLISRTGTKLKDVALEIENDFQIETKILQFDFTKTSGYERIENVVNDLDIGILVNNVAMASRSFTAFHECDMENAVATLQCNIFSDVRMTNIVLKGMTRRGRGAIIHLASSVMYLDAPYVNVYGPSKNFMRKFVKSLQLEYSGQIFHQLVAPAFVATNMSRRKISFWIPSAEDFVYSAIRTIGITEVTCGYFLHELQALLLCYLPQFVITYAIRKLSKKTQKKQ